MPSLIGLRITSLLVVIPFLVALPRSQVLLVISFLGLAHYAVSAIYSLPVVQKNYLQQRHFGGLILLASFCAAAMYFEWPHIFFFFYIHHVLSELYAPKAIYGSESLIHNDLLFYLRALFHSLAYAHVLILPHSKKYGTDLVLGLFLAFCLISIVYFYKIQKNLRLSNTAKDLFFAEIIVFILVVLNFTKVISFGFYEFLFYHFVYWTFAPVPSLLSKSRVQLAKYCLLTGSMVLFCYFLVYVFSLSKQVLFGSALSVTALAALNFFGFFHISTSFGLSKSNPRWIQKIFSW